MLHPDFRDMLSCLKEEGAEFIVVGAYALAAHGLPRATGDIDIRVRNAPDNAGRVVRALTGCGAPVSDLSEQDFTALMWRRRSGRKHMGVRISGEVMSSLPTTYLTPGQYLAAERKADYKSEYVDGEMVAMTGASRKHNLIVFNLTREIGQQLRGRPCEGYASDMRVRVPSTRLYTYPDVVVVCGEPQFEDDHVDTLLNPTLIIEAPSESAELYDRGKKFGFYRTLESLAEYLLVAQDEHRIEQYVRRPDGRWLLSEYRSLEDVIELPSIQCRLSMREVYDKVASP